MDDRIPAAARASAGLLGALLCSAAVLADVAGLSAGGLGEGQVLAGVFGLLLLLFALSGRRFPTFWLYSGRILLACSAAFLLAGASRAFLSALRGNPPGAAADLLTPGMVPCADESLFYRPHVLWVGSRGDAGGPEGPSQPDSSRTIWLYGSSTDRPSPDAIAGPAGASAASEGIVVDRRQPCYNSTQSLILLMQDLCGSPPPDSVILLAGPSDIAAALENHDPVWPLGAASFLGRTRASADLSLELESRELVQEFERVQEINRAALAALSVEYGFGASFEWIGGTKLPPCSTADRAAFGKLSL
jgi:hypothetical protein